MSSSTTEETKHPSITHPEAYATQLRILGFDVSCQKSADGKPFLRNLCPTCAHDNPGICRSSEVEGIAPSVCPSCHGLGQFHVVDPEVKPAGAVLTFLRGTSLDDCLRDQNDTRSFCFHRGNSVMVASPADYEKTIPALRFDDARVAIAKEWAEGQVPIVVEDKESGEHFIIPLLSEEEGSMWKWVEHQY